MTLIFKVGRPVIISKIRRTYFRDPDPAGNSGIGILGRIYVYGIVEDYEAWLAAAPAYFNTVKIHYGHGCSAPALTVPFLIGTVGVFRSCQVETVAQTLLILIDR